MLFLFCLLFCSEISDDGEGPNGVHVLARELAMKELGVGELVLDDVGLLLALLL